MKKILFLIILTLILIPKFAFAQQVTSNKVNTKFGNPIGPAPALSSSNDLATAAINLVSAYKTKSNGYTNSSYPVEPLADFLGSFYADSIIQSFKIRRNNAMPTPSYCVECLGFVGISMTLASGNTDSFTGGRAAEYYNRDSFTTAGATFKRVSPEDIRPGDVGVTTADSNDASVGHILIVKEASVVSPATFIGLESSYPVHCQVNDQQSHVRKNYNFYRKQS